MRPLWVLPLVLALSGCNWINHITGLSKDSDKAVGAACRQVGQSLDECFTLNPGADKAQVYAGWREMHEYMVKEQLPTMSPPPPPPPPPTASSGARKTSDNGDQGDNAAAGAPGDNGKVDPEVQAVLDTINNRPEATASAPMPTAAEQQQLKQMLSQKKKS